MCALLHRLGWSYFRMWRQETGGKYQQKTVQPGTEKWSGLVRCVGRARSGEEKILQWGRYLTRNPGQLSWQNRENRETAGRERTIKSQLCFIIIMSPGVMFTLTRLWHEISLMFYVSGLLWAPDCVREGGRREGIIDIGTVGGDEWSC